MTTEIKFYGYGEQHTGSNRGKLADAEVHFTGGLFDGLKLCGFAVWASMVKNGPTRVTVPARHYSINGERRTFSLLRPIVFAENFDSMKSEILDAFNAFIKTQEGK